MPLSNPDLWQKIADWPLPYRAERDKDAEPPRDCTCFEHNLRRKGDWTDVSAARITQIYRKFLYLKALSGQAVTPSGCIDEAWHLHLSHPENYAALCRLVGRDIPHQTQLSYVERQRAYDRGRALFTAEFDTEPDRDLWPSGAAMGDADKLFLMVLGGGIACMFLVAMGAAAKTWVVAIPIVAIAVVVGVLTQRWGGTTPDQISRCG